MKHQNYYSKGYQPIDNGKGKGKPPSLRKEPEQQNIRKYRFVEVMDESKAYGGLGWEVQVYEEGKWIAYVEQEYKDYQTALNIFKKITNKTRSVKVLREAEI